MSDDTEINNEYPRMLYGPDRQTRFVASELEEASAGPLWDRTPSDEHRKALAMATNVYTYAGGPVAHETLTPQVSQPTLVLDEALLDRIADRVIERLSARQLPRSNGAAEKHQPDG